MFIGVQVCILVSGNKGMKCHTCKLRISVFH